MDRSLGVIASEEGSLASSHSTLPLDNRSPGSYLPPSVGGFGTHQPHDDDSSSDEDDDEFERRAQASRERDRVGRAESIHFPVLGGSTTSAVAVGGPPSSLTFGGMPSTIESSGGLAFKDPTAPTGPKDSRPLWKIQEARRRKKVREKMVEGLTLEDYNIASIKGRLLGERRARAPDMKKMMHMHNTPRDKEGKKVEVLESHKMVADNIIKTADQGTVDNSVSLNELQVFLEGTFYAGFMKWLTGKEDGDASRFHSLDDDGNHSIEVEELSVAVADYYSGYLKGVGWEEVVEFAEKSREEMEQQKKMRRRTIAKQKRITIRKAEEKKAREDHRKKKAAEKLVSTDHEKLDKIRHRLLAASYSSTTWGMNFELMFERFDRDQNGELDLEELHTLVRKVLHVPPTAITDVELEALFSFLDYDGGGSIDQEELIAFIKKGEEEKMGVDLLPSHLKYMGPKRTEHEELCALINFKTKEEKEKEEKEEQPPPGEIPWNTSIISNRTEKPLVMCRHTGYIPLDKR